MADVDIRGENVLLTVRKHWVILAQEAAATFCVGVIPFLFLGALSNAPYGFASDLSYLRVIGALWLLVAWMAFAIIWTAYYLDIWLVTDKHIYAIEQLGLFNRKVRTVSLERVQEINVRTEGFMQTFFGYGTIEVHTASANEENAVFSGIPNPHLVRSLVLDQIEQYVKLEKENETLTTTTKDQEKLIHFVGHEVKGYLTKSAGALAAIAEGDLGSVPQPVQQMAGSALQETRKGVDTVMNILQGSDAAKGTLSIVKNSFDAKQAVLDCAIALQGNAKAKGLAYNVFAGEGSYTVHGDEQKLREHVFRNLIDNAIRYTPSGSIRVDLLTNGRIFRMEVKDSGVGITPADMQKLFSEGGHGENSKAVNPESTGYGLSIAKQVVEAHGGRIWAQSDGAGTGSTFIVELPTAY